MSYEVIRNKDVKTRKIHVCCWCGDVINIGELAQARTYQMDGDLKNDYMHPECNIASMKVAVDEGCCIEWQPGDYPRGGTEAI